MRQGDAVWEDIVRWSLNTMIEAEEYGVNSSNASSLKDSDNPAIKRLVGAEGELGAAFGLDNGWSLRIIEQVGNYGESYKKHIADTGILPNRGPNELWTKGEFFMYHQQIIANKLKRAGFLRPFFLISFLQ